MAPKRGRARRILRIAVPTLLGVFLLMQLVPYGWEHPNPPVQDEPPWPDAAVEQLARDACYDCHSNETEWPAYAYVAPMSWLVRSDVESGRDELNFSTWLDDEGEADDAAEEIADGSMPPGPYLRLHPDADLSDAEQRQLMDALRSMDD
jgi:hypothetical protein